MTIRIRPNAPDVIGAARQAEQHRVSALIDLGRTNRDREERREIARAQVANGSFENLADTVMEPTPEWMERNTVRRLQPDGTVGEERQYRNFTPRLHEGEGKTVRTVRSVRRVEEPVVVGLRLRDAINDEQAAACLWYRRVYETGGMDGRYSAVRYGPECGLRAASPSASNAAGGLPATAEEELARKQLRAARAAMPAAALRFFEAVVLNDIPMRRAARFARCRYDRSVHLFRLVAQELVTHCERASIDLQPIRGR